MITLSGSRYQFFAMIKPLFTAWLLAITVARLMAQNDKLVLSNLIISEAEVQQGTSVLYLIRFQNTGSDTVSNLFIRDTLDSRYEQGTFEMVASSHDYQIVREGGDVVKWVFNQIELPDSSSNQNNSHGYVLFKAMPKTTLTGGQIITNKAYIYFENGPPAVTNTAIVWIDSNSNVTEQALLKTRIFPNPGNGIFQVSFGADQLGCPNQVIDAAGVPQAFELTQNGPHFQLALTHPKSGLHYIVMDCDGRQIALPFIIQQ